MLVHFDGEPVSISRRYRPLVTGDEQTLCDEVIDEMQREMVEDFTAETDNRPVRGGVVLDVDPDDLPFD